MNTKKALRRLRECVDVRELIIAIMAVIATLLRRGDSK